jgi:hypothetical protein
MITSWILLVKILQHTIYIVSENYCKKINDKNYCRERGIKVITVDIVADCLLLLLYWPLDENLMV